MAWDIVFMGRRCNRLIITCRILLRFGRPGCRLFEGRRRRRLWLIWRSAVMCICRLGWSIFGPEVIAYLVAGSRWWNIVQSPGRLLNVELLSLLTKGRHLTETTIPRHARIRGKRLFFSILKTRNPFSKHRRLLSRMIFRSPAFRLILCYT